MQSSAIVGGSGTCCGVGSSRDSELGDGRDPGSLGLTLTGCGDDAEGGSDCGDVALEGVPGMGVSGMGVSGMGVSGGALGLGV